MILSRRTSVLRVLAATAMLGVATALVASNLFAFRRHEWGYGTLRSWTEMYRHEYGWPWSYRTREVNAPSGSKWVVDTSRSLNEPVVSNATVTRVTSGFRISFLIRNLLVAILILGGTSTALEIWRRTPRHIPLPLKSVFLVAVMSVLCTWGDWSLPIYLQIPISFGIACSLFVAVSLIVHVISALAGVQRPAPDECEATSPSA